MNLNRYELLEELYNETSHNLYCYSEDALMTKPKIQYEEQWKKQLEKLELIQEMINEEKQKGELENMSFTLEQILRMYPNTQYYVRNSNGGLLAGTFDLKDAKKYAERYKKEYLQDSLNNHLEVCVYDKEGKNVYVAKGLQSNIESEETEEFE